MEHPSRRSVLLGAAGIAVGGGLLTGTPASGAPAGTGGAPVSAGRAPRAAGGAHRAASGAPISASGAPISGGRTPGGAASGPHGPASALAELVAGNRRFVAGRARHPHQSLADLHDVAAGQHPFAITLGCADSRVSPELLFDQGLGDIFDNRVAGNIVDDLLLGSIEFAVEEFHSPLIVVLGHERCGAITATVDAIESGGTAPGHIGAIVDALRPIVAPVLNRPGDKVDNGVRANVRAQAAALTARSGLLAAHVAAGELRIVGACYDLDTGRATFLRP